MIDPGDASNAHDAFVCLNYEPLRKVLQKLGGGTVQIVTPCGDRLTFDALPSRSLDCSCGRPEHATLICHSLGRA